MPFWNTYSGQLELMLSPWVAFLIWAGINILFSHLVCLAWTLQTDAHVPAGHRYLAVPFVHVNLGVYLAHIHSGYSVSVYCMNNECAQGGGMPRHSAFLGLLRWHHLTRA